MADTDTEAVAASEAAKASPWPLFVALGLAVGEVGVFMGLYPVAVAGLLLFVGSIAGIVQEAGYSERPWKLLAGLGGLLVVVGAWVVTSQTGIDAAAMLAAVDGADTIVLRGFSIAAAGVIALAASVAGVAVADDDPFPA
ncbi:DUF7541 family protein [Halosegnis marinus]|uniref:Cox cluster protein n=1 Tax=Halosegnis marinus TaxID=3034023 RepID=A0ABD5ZRY8_9EURY|nr:hypothetical protein [Halosegnis sp. DT85]